MERFTGSPIKNVDDLDHKLSEPAPDVIEAVGKLSGDLLILGAGGKIGPSLTQMAARAIRESGVERKLFGVSAVFDDRARRKLESLGVKTIKTDLLAPGALDKLPEAANVIYMCGQKFGSTGAEWFTWGINVLLAGLAAGRYRDSRIVAYSSGNIYPFVPVSSGGAVESTPPAPVGEYAMSCLGRERMFDYYSETNKTKVLHFRLNYAAELRYGILLDVAEKVRQGLPVDVTMGNVNVAWQGYVNAVTLRCLALADSPPRVLNVTGPETVSIRWLATRFGELLGKPPKIVGEEAPNVLLSNAAQCHKLFGYPQISVETLVEWVAQWVTSGGETLGKPTHYETRDGKF